MEAANPYRCDGETLLLAKARECAELREMCAAVAQELERMAGERPELASRLLARAQRIRWRLHRV